MTVFRDVDRSEAISCGTRSLDSFISEEGTPSVDSGEVSE